MSALNAVIPKLTGGLYKQEDQTKPQHSSLNAQNAVILGENTPEAINLFKIKLLNAKKLKDIISAISILVDEASFDITPSDIKLRAMDPSHIAMVDFVWEKEAFDEFICEAETKLCINISELLKLLKRVSETETAELTLDEKTGRLEITLQGEYIRKFSMPILETVSEEVPSPKITFLAAVEIETACLKNATDDAGSVSDHIIFEITGEKFSMKAAGDLGSVATELNKDSKVVLEFKVEKESRAIYSLSYLSEIVKAASSTADTVKVEFSTDLPVKLSFGLTQGHLIYYLAPRIE